jgi:hypothetical protein
MVSIIPDDVTKVLNGLCRDVACHGRRIPNPHTLTLAVKATFGEELWMPTENSLFAISLKKGIARWEVVERNLDENQPHADVLDLTRYMQRYIPVK